MAGVDRTGPRRAILGAAPRPLGPLHRAHRRVRAAVVHLLCAVGGAALGLLLPLAHVPPMLSAGRVGTTLATLGFGLIGVISVIFSLLYLVAQWAFANFTPRLSSFVDDPLVWRTFGLSIGLFVFCIVAAIDTANRDRVTVLVPLVALFGVLAVLTLIREVQFAAFGAEGDELAESRALLEKSWADPTMIMHAVWMDGEIISAGTAAPVSEGLLLYGGATAPHARGRGGYRALLHARWDEAVARGTPALITQGGSMSRPILERAGFEPVGHIHILLDEFAERDAG